MARSIPRGPGGHGFGMTGHDELGFVVSATWQMLWWCGVGCHALTCPRTDCPAAGLLVSLGRRGAGVGHGWLVLRRCGAGPSLFVVSIDPDPTWGR